MGIHTRHTNAARIHQYHIHKINIRLRMQQKQILKRTFNGGTVSEMPLYLVEIDGISIKSVKSQFDIIPNLQELIDKMVMYKE